MVVFLRGVSGVQVLDSSCCARPMKPPKFRYFAPQSVGEALALLAEHADEARVLAGGQSLGPLMNMRPGHPGGLVDTNKMDELAYIKHWGGGPPFGPMPRAASL